MTIKGARPQLLETPAVIAEALKTAKSLEELRAKLASPVYVAVIQRVGREIWEKSEGRNPKAEGEQNNTREANTLACPKSETPKAEGRVICGKTEVAEWLMAMHGFPILKS